MDRGGGRGLFAGIKSFVLFLFQFILAASVAQVKLDGVSKKKEKFDPTYKSSRQLKREAAKEAVRCFALEQFAITCTKYQR